MRKREHTTIDGQDWSKSVESKLNTLAQATFGSKEGQEFLQYLRNITLNRPQGPSSVEVLNHLEGQRYLVGIIEQRVHAGRREENVRRTRESISRVTKRADPGAAA